MEIKDSEGKNRSAFKLTVVDDEMRIVRAIYSKFMELQSLAKTAL